MIIKVNQLNKEILDVEDISNKIIRHPVREWKTRSVDDLNKIVVHCLGTNNQDPFKTNRYHIRPNHITNKGMNSIAYHDFIRNDGKIFHCNKYQNWTWHCGLWNKKSVGIVMGFDGKGLPPDAQYKSLLLLLSNLCIDLNIHPTKIKAHREAPWLVVYLGHGSRRYKKICPGLMVDPNFIRKVVSALIQARMRTIKLYTGKVDGLWGPKSEKGFRRINKRNKKYLLISTSDRIT